MKKSISGKIIFLIALCIFATSICATTVRADMGPKPSIDITIVNGPDDYYIALLGERDQPSGKNSKLKLDEVVDESVEEYLEEFCQDGWYYFKSPVGGNLFRNEDGDDFHFGYMVPNPFKIIIIDGEGNVVISEAYEKKDLNVEVTYDVSTGIITGDESDRIVKNVKTVAYIIICFVLTVLFEALILKLFRYPFSKGNVTAFLITNVITNIPFCVIMTLISVAWPFFILELYFEIVIIIVESIVYALTLRDEYGDRHQGKSILYGIVANVFSAVMGFILFFVYMMIL